MRSHLVFFLSFLFLFFVCLVVLRYTGYRKWRYCAVFVVLERMAGGIFVYVSYSYHSPAMCFLLFLCLFVGYVFSRVASSVYVCVCGFEYTVAHVEWICFLACLPLALAECLGIWSLVGGCGNGGSGRFMRKVVIVR